MVSTSSWPRRSAVAPDRVAVAFVRALRDAGLDVPVGATVTFAEALAEVGLLRESSLYWTGRATLVTRVEAFAVYDRVFEEFWHRRFIGEALELPADEILLAVEEEDDDDAAA